VGGTDPSSVAKQNVQKNIIAHKSVLEHEQGSLYKWYAIASNTYWPCVFNRLA